MCTVFVVVFETRNENAVTVLLAVFFVLFVVMLVYQSLSAFWGVKGLHCMIFRLFLFTDSLAALCFMFFGRFAHVALFILCLLVYAFALILFACYIQYI